TGDLRRSDADLCRLRSGVHPLGGRPGVLRTERVLVRPEAVRELPSQPPRQPRRRLRRPGHRWAARLRARRRSRGTGVLRGHLFILRQPGAGSVQAAHGPAGLLLGLFPTGEAGLTCPDVALEGEGPTRQTKKQRNPRTPRSQSPGRSFVSGSTAVAPGRRWTALDPALLAHAASHALAP